MIDQAFITLIQLTLALCVIIPCVGTLLPSQDLLVDVPEYNDHWGPCTCENRTEWSLEPDMTWEEDTFTTESWVALAFAAHRADQDRAMWARVTAYAA